jgi:hypothetical protein
MVNPALNKVAEEIFEKKKRRRRLMAQLPVEEKFATLLKLQQVAFDIATAAGRKVRRPWNVK